MRQSYVHASTVSAYCVIVMQSSRSCTDAVLYCALSGNVTHSTAKAIVFNLCSLPSRTTCSLACVERSRCCKVLRLSSAGTELVAILRADQTLAPDFFVRTLPALELADVRLAQGRLVCSDLPAAADVFDVVGYLHFRTALLLGAGMSVLEGLGRIR